VLCAVLVLAPAAGVTGEEAAATVAQGSLQACAAIAADTDRLACYDRLAGRSMKGATAPAAAVPSGAAAAASTTSPVPTAPAATAPPAAATPPTSTTPGAATSASTAAAAGTAANFGLYPAEHPAAPAVAKSLQARVVDLGKSPGGRMTVALEGGAVWELDDGADPLLAAGDVVTLRRAALGSFEMQTPTRRTHRVHRLH